MKQKKREKKNPGKFHILSLTVEILLIVVGLAMILYPTVADMINDADNKEAIADYRDNVRSFGTDEYSAMLDAAREYNAMLAEKTPYIGELTRENRKLYENLLNVAGNGIIGYIEIPKSDIYLAVYHGTDERVLQTGVGHLEGSSLPVTGESVHTVLTGHSGLPSAKLFTDLDQLEIGDTFTLHILNETLTYKVNDIKRMLPEELEDMKIETGRELCTLLTCTPYGINTHRLAVTGYRVETPLSETDPPSLKQALTSGWNWTFLILPAAVIAFVVAAVVLIRRKIKRKKQEIQHSPDAPKN